MPSLSHKRSRLANDRHAWIRMSWRGPRRAGSLFVGSRISLSAKHVGTRTSGLPLNSPAKSATRLRIMRYVLRVSLRRDTRSDILRQASSAVSIVRVSNTSTADLRGRTAHGKGHRLGDLYGSPAPGPIFPIANVERCE